MDTPIAAARELAGAEGPQLDTGPVSQTAEPCGQSSRSTRLVSIGTRGRRRDKPLSAAVSKGNTTHRRGYLSCRFPPVAEAAPELAIPPGPLRLVPHTLESSSRGRVAASSCELELSARLTLGSHGATGHPRSPMLARRTHACDPARERMANPSQPQLWPAGCPRRRDATLVSSTVGSDDGGSIACCSAPTSEARERETSAAQHALADVPLRLRFHRRA